MIAGHHIVMAKSVVSGLALRKTGASSQGFVCSSPGTMPMGVTFTCWFRFSFPENVSFSEATCVMKYGNNSSGAGIGAYKNPGATAAYSSVTALCEGKYWLHFDDGFGGVVTNTPWRHLAFIVKSGTNPFQNAVYIDGTKAQASTLQGFSDTSGVISSPTGSFSLCGRPSNDTLNCTVDLFSPRVYGSELASSDVFRDMRNPLGIPSGVTHAWDGSVEQGLVKDLVGGWNLSTSTGCSIENVVIN